MRLFLVVALSVFALSGCAWLQKTFHGEEDLPPAIAETPPPLEEPAEPATEPTGPIMAGAGETCGGIAAIQCSEGLFCKMEDGACRDIADAAGTCTEVRPMCTREYRPVCGCDGKTYGNRCEAYAAMTSVAAEGPCEAEEAEGS